MKKLILILIIISFVLSGLTGLFASGYSLSSDERLYFSKLDQEYLEEADPDDGIILIKQFGENKIETKFPAKPDFFSTENTLGKTYLYRATDGDVIYELVITDVKKELPNHPYTKVKTPFGKAFDFSYEKEGKLFRERLLFWENKTLHFITSGVKKQNHIDFIDSFQVITPLK